MEMGNRTFIGLLVTKITKVGNTKSIKLKETKTLCKPLDQIVLERDL